MLSRLAIAAICCFAFAGTTLAADPVPGLIEDLASGDFRTREAATKQLEAIGEPALDALKKAAKTHADPEAARRAGELVVRIGKKVDNEKTLAPTLVELSFKDQPLGDVIAAIEKQSGYQISYSEFAGNQKAVLVTVNTEGKVPFWTALDKVCEAAKLEVSTTDVGVANGYPQTGRGSNPYRTPTPPMSMVSVLMLRELKGERKPAFVRGAMRITYAMLPHAAYATYPKDTIPVVISVQPEPKLRWERVQSIGILKAKDDGGQELIALSSQNAGPEGMNNMVPSVMPVRGGNIVIGPNGAMMIPNQGADTAQPGFPTLATQGLARLKAGSEPTKSLTTLNGTIRGTVRTAPEELASISGLELAKNAAPVKGPNGITLNATGFAVKADSLDTFELDATMTYNPSDVQIGALGGMPVVQETVIVQGAGRVIVRRQVGGFNGQIENGPGSPRLAGLTVSDAEGQPFLLTAASYRRQLEADGRSTDSIKLIIKPSEKTSGKPVSISFSASRSKTVEFPFELHNVPVSSGLGPVEAPRSPGLPPIPPR